MPAVCCRHHALIKSLQRQIEVQYKVQMGDKGTQDAGLGTPNAGRKRKGAGHNFNQTSLTKSPSPSE